MRRQISRSQILFPGLVLLALALFFVPEAQVLSLRGQYLSALRPVLKPFNAIVRTTDPQPASISLDLKSSETPKSTQPDQTNGAKPDAMPSGNTAHDAELDRLRAELVRVCSLLNKMNSVGEAPSLPSVQADILLRKSLWGEPILALNRGDSDGVRLNAAVLHRGAVFGRIVSIGAHASCVALLTHKGLSVTARLAQCRAEGVLQGSKDEGAERMCRLLVVGRELNAKVGEHVVTSGYDGTFPPDLWLGVVTGIKRSGDVQWELSVRPACNENAAETVHVLTGAPPDAPWPVMPSRTQKPAQVSK